MVKNQPSTPSHSTHPSKYRPTDSISQLSLSVRAYNALRRAGIFTIGELVNRSENQILEIRNVGRKTIDEIREVLEKASLSLNNTSQVEEPETPFHHAPRESQQVTRPIDTLGLPHDTIQALIEHGFTTLGSLLDAPLSSCMATSISSKAWGIIYEKCKNNLAWQEWDFPPRNTTQQGFTDLQDIGLDKRSANALYRAEITDARLALSTTFAELVTVRQVGRGSISQLLDALRTLSQEELDWLLDSHRDENPIVLPSPMVKKLAESDIVKPSDLSVHTQESLIADVGLTYGETITIQKVMSEAGMGLSEQWPNESLVKESDYKFLVRLGVPLDSIPIVRIALPRKLEAKLRQLRYNQVGPLARESKLILQAALGPRYSSDLPQARRNLSQYFHWLSLQSSWESEINNEGLSPLYYRWLEETTVTDIVKKHFAQLPKREKEIIIQRNNLDGKGKQTLDQVGEYFDLTRERIRQLQKKAETRLTAIITDRLCVAFLNLMYRAISKAGGLLPIYGLVEASEAYGVRLGQMDGPALIEFLMELDFRFQKDRTTRAWGIDDFPLEATDLIVTISKELLTNAKAPIQEEKFLDSIKESLHGVEISDRFVLACWRASDELLEEDGWWKLEKWTRHRLDDLIMVLRRLGEPTHYKTLTQLVNECVPENLRASEHTVHAEIRRHLDVFVWQESGIYGLAEWGMERKRFYVDIAEEFLRKQGKPLAFDEIFAVITAEREASPDSIVFMLQTNPRFYQHSKNTFGLACWQKEPEQKKAEKDPFLEELKRKVFDDF